MLQNVCGLCSSHPFNPQQLLQILEALQSNFLYLHFQPKQMC
jgi:hypothetical protein